MSTRQLRRIREKQQQAQLDVSAEDTDDDQEAIVYQPKRQQASLFAALGAQDEGDDDEEEADEEPLAEQAVESLPAKTTPGKRKNKKKKKKRKDDADQLGDKKQPRRQDSVDDIDKALEALGMSDVATRASDPKTDAGADGGRTGATSNPKMDQLLSISTYHLRPSNEMKHMFGRDIVSSASAQEAEEEAARRAQARRRGIQNVDIETFLKAGPREPRLPEMSLKKNVFVLGREHWPRASSGGLTMTVVAQHRGSTEYTFAHDEVYEGVQAGFFHFVMIGDPMKLIHLAKQQPYHVSTLLQASNIAKGDGNAPLAAELCERALFSFGRITTSGFRRDFEKGAARLDFSRPENRQFWLAGYMYLRGLIKKGTYRTALEWAKALFALDRRDPYMMRLFMHTLAVRSGEAAWFVDFCEADPDKYEPSHVYMAQTKAIAQLLLGDAEGARASMRKGISDVPWLYAALFSALQLDLPPSIWGLQPPGDHQLWTAFYMHLTKDLWNGHPRAVSMVKEEAAKLPKQVISPDAAALGFATLDLARVVFLEGQPSLLAFVPKHFLTMEPNFEFDPLPPEEQNNIFSGEAMRLPWRHAQAQRESREQHMRLRRGLPANMAGADDAEAHERMWLQFLEEEGRRVVAQQQQRGGGGGGGEGDIDGDGDDDLPPGLIAEGGGDDDLDEDGNGGAGGLTTRMQRIGMQAWIMQQLETWMPPFREGAEAEGPEGGEGEGEEDEEEDEYGGEMSQGPDRASGGGGGGEGGEAQRPPIPRRQSMPGAWPTVETDSEDEGDDR